MSPDYEKSDSFPVVVDIDPPFASSVSFMELPTNDAWNDTKLEKAKGDTIPEDAKIVVKFYKTNKIIKTNYCPLIDGASDYCEEKQNLLNLFFLVLFLD